MARERENLPVEVRPYRVGLTLSGGGAKGFAHVGALKAMEELGIRPDIISGTSAGAVIAVLYADGYSPDEILDLFSGLSFNDLAEITLPRSCFFKIDRFKHFLQKSLRAVNIEDLSIPVVVTATDLDHGKYVVFPLYFLRFLSMVRIMSMEVSCVICRFTPFVPSAMSL